MNKVLVYSIIYLFGVFISSLAQYLLKKNTNNKYKSVLKEYLNFKTITAYLIFFGATLITLFAYKVIPLSYGPLLEASQYIFITLISYFLLKENINKYKIFGIILIIVGIFIYFI